MTRKLDRIPFFSIVWLYWLCFFFFRRLALLYGKISSRKPRNFTPRSSETFITLTSGPNELKFHLPWSYWYSNVTGSVQPQPTVSRGSSLTVVIFSVLYRSTLSVIAAYLDAFQKIADSATNAKGKKINGDTCCRAQISSCWILRKKQQQSLLPPTPTVVA